MGRVLTQNQSEDLPTAQEFEFTAQDYKYIQWFMHKTVGIYLSDRKRAMVYGRVSRNLRKRGLTRFSEYRLLIESDEKERIHFINSLTTNKTEFFREYHHFEFLEKILLPELHKRGQKSFTMWSAGCSTGEEPYSFVASLYASGCFDWCNEISILASDLDTMVLEKAQSGVYSDESVTSIPQQYLKPCFVRGKGKQAGNFKIAKGLQNLIDFRQINLLDKWPMDQQFDLISCRNVMIYFDQETQISLLTRFHQQLKPGGVLLLGHSESAGGCADLFRHLGHTIYIKQ
ncbi:CheR family methyltransferase [Vibrio sp.]|uniref:CheR family methyltransferase n=1 Tax=Vibrio sp. TaxID=678 RepID=UPI003D0EB901